MTLYFLSERDFYTVLSFQNLESFNSLNFWLTIIHLCLKKIAEKIKKISAGDSMVELNEPLGPVSTWLREQCADWLKALRVSYGGTREELTENISRNNVHCMVK